MTRPVQPAFMGSVSSRSKEASAARPGRAATAGPAPSISGRKTKKAQELKQEAFAQAQGLENMKREFSSKVDGCIRLLQKAGIPEVEHLSNEAATHIENAIRLYKARKAEMDKVCDAITAALDSLRGKKDQQKEVLQNKRREIRADSKALSDFIDLHETLLEFRELMRNPGDHADESDRKRAIVRFNEIIRKLKQIPPATQLLWAKSDQTSARDLLLKVLQEAEVFRDAETMIAVYGILEIEAAQPTAEDMRFLRNAVPFLNERSHYSELHLHCLEQCKTSRDGREAMATAMACIKEEAKEADKLALGCQHLIVAGQKRNAASLVGKHEMPEDLKAHLQECVLQNIGILEALLEQAIAVVPANHMEAILNEMVHRTEPDYLSDPRRDFDEKQESCRLLQLLEDAYGDAAMQLELAADRVRKEAADCPAQVSQALNLLAADMRDTAEQIGAHMWGLRDDGIVPEALRGSEASRKAKQTLARIDWFPVAEEEQTDDEEADEATAEPASASAPSAETARKETVLPIRPKLPLGRLNNIVMAGKRLGVLVNQNLHDANDRLKQLRLGRTGEKYTWGNVKTLVETALKYRQEQIGLTDKLLRQWAAFADRPEAGKKLGELREKRRKLEAQLAQEKTSGMRLIAEAIALMPRRARAGMDYAEEQGMKLEVQRPYILPSDEGGPEVHEYIHSIRTHPQAKAFSFKLHVDIVDGVVVSINYKRMDEAGFDDDSVRSYYPPERKAKKEAYYWEDSEAAIERAERYVDETERTPIPLPQGARRW